MSRPADPFPQHALLAFEQRALSGEAFLSVVQKWMAEREEARATETSTREVAETLAIGLGAGNATHVVLAQDRENRFVHLRPHAKGGLGQVSLALDCQLQRRVALKEILPDRANDPESQRRFLAEGEITGQLEHPGIVPVYGLGVDSGGRPYYAMRFVEGKTLKRAIEEFHRGRSSSTPLVGQRTVEFRNLLGRFVDICNAIAYAHSRKVLHRDLKPENILLGPYGETLVVDWGLAKSLGDEAAGDANAPEVAEKSLQVVRLRSGSSSDTLDGTAMGTPAYMSPEQAEGSIQLLGPATDVYSLGATLYAILTGEPPVKGDSVVDTLARAKRSEFERPRTAWRSIPRALEAVCLKAMSALPEDRYRSARDLANEIERWLADEPVEAYLEPLWVRGRRWVRRHPGLVSAATAGGGLALVGAVIVAGLQSAHAKALEEKNKTIGLQVSQLTRQNQTIEFQNSQLAETNENLAAANEKEKLATQLEAASRKEAEQQRDRAESVTDFLVQSFRKVDPESDGKKLTVYDSLVRSLKEIDIAQGMSPLNKAEILDAMRRTFNGLGMPQEEFEAARRVKEIFHKELPADNPDVIFSISNLGLAMRSKGETEEAIKLFQEAVEKWRTKAGEHHLHTLRAKSNLAGAYKESGRFDLALKLYEEAYENMKTQVEERDEDLLTLQGNLAAIYNNLGDIKRAIDLEERKLTVEKEIFGEEHPRVLTTQNNLATSYNNDGRPDLGMPMLQKTLTAAKSKLGEDHLTTLTIQNNLAHQLLLRGQNEEAKSLFASILKAETGKLGERHPSVLRTEGNLAAAYAASGNQEEALARYESLLKRSKEVLGEDHPYVLILENDRATTLQALDRLDDATKALEVVLEKRRKILGSEHPDTFVSQNNLAHAYQKAERLDDAAELYRQALDGQKAKLGVAHANTLTTQNNLATVYRHLHKPELAIPLAEEVYQIFGKQYGADHPNTITGGTNLSLYYCDDGQIDKAIETLTKCLASARAVTRLDSAAVQRSHLILASIYFLAKRDAEGEAIVDDYLDRMAKIDGDDFDSARRHFVSAAMALQQSNRLAKSEAVLRKLQLLAKEKAPGQLKTILCDNLLAEVLRHQGRLEDSLLAYEKAFANLSAYQGKEAESTRGNMAMTAEIICEIYSELGRDEEAVKWRKKVDELNKPAAAPP